MKQMCGSIAFGDVGQRWRETPENDARIMAMENAKEMENCQRRLKTACEQQDGIDLALRTALAQFAGT
jgi:hypothetical protein